MAEWRGGSGGSGSSSRDGNSAAGIGIGIGAADGTLVGRGDVEVCGLEYGLSGDGGHCAVGWLWGKEGCGWEGLGLESV